MRRLPVRWTDNSNTRMPKMFDDRYLCVTQEIDRSARIECWVSVLKTGQKMSLLRKSTNESTQNDLHVIFRGLEGGFFVGTAVPAALAAAISLASAISSARLCMEG